MWNYPGLCRFSPDVLTLEFFAYICLFTLIDLLSTTSWRISILYLLQTSHNWLYDIPSTVSNLTSSSLFYPLYVENILKSNTHCQFTLFPVYSMFIWLQSGKSRNACNSWEHKSFSSLSKPWFALPRAFTYLISFVCNFVSHFHSQPQFFSPIQQLNISQAWTKM